MAMDAMPDSATPSAVRLLAQHGGVGHLMARGTAFLLPFSGRALVCFVFRGAEQWGFAVYYGKSRRPIGLEKQMGIN